jgi:UDP-N-acetylglucosamine 2-epimerase
VESIVNSAREIIEGNVKKGKIPKYWDGKTANRIVKVLDEWFEKKEEATENTEYTEK